MNPALKILAIIFTSVTSIRSFVLSLQRVRGVHGWLMIFDIVASTIIMFFGPVLAAEMTSWSYGIGAVLACLPFLVLLGRWLLRCYRQRQVTTNFGEMGSTTSWEVSTTFNLTLAVFRNLILLILADCRKAISGH